MVYSKAKSFRCNTYKKHGGGGALADRPPLCASVPLWQSLHLPRVTEHRSRDTSHQSRITRHPSRPIAAKRLWCNNSQRRENSSRSGETTPLPPVSNTRERTSGTVRQCSRSETPIRSGLQVVPGSIVLKLDRSRVARSPHPARMSVNVGLERPAVSDWASALSWGREETDLVHELQAGSA